jgi:nitrogen fixation/metabolism regulation signal transduction histidine kinase
MTDADDPTRLIAELRARVEEATTQMDQLVAELTDRRRATDDLESLVDVLLDHGEATVVVVDDERRIRALSRAAALRLDGAAVGKPLSSAVPDELYDRVTARLESGRAAGGDGGAGEIALVHPLPGGGAVLVLEAR